MDPQRNRPAIKKRIRFFYKLKKRKWFKTNVKPFLQVHLTDHCNLNCKGCAHFSPIAKPKCIDFELLQEMFNKLQPMETLFSRLELMGGEPLLHPEINRILELTRKTFPTIQIRLVTNGINLDKMPESFYETCSDNAIIIYISIYPINLNHALITHLLDSYGVSYGLYGNYEECKVFYSYKLNPEGKYRIKRNYNHCGLGGRCLQLKDNRIYPCFLSAYANHLNCFFNTNFSWKDSDYLSIDKPITKKQFHKFINSPAPFCRYCNIRHIAITEWELSQKKADEWII